MATICITKYKGGSGASTMTRELAVAAVLDGLRVALIDLDAQGGTATWWADRTDGLPEDADINPRLLDLGNRLPELPSLLEGLGRKYNVILIDVPPSAPPFLEKVLAKIDLAIVPVKPTKDDLIAVPKTLEMLKPTGGRFAFVLNQVFPGGAGRTRAAEATERLAKRGRVIGRIGNRVAYPDAGAIGQTSLELSPKDKAAIAEISEVWAFLREELGLPVPAAAVT